VKTASHAAALVLVVLLLGACVRDDPRLNSPSPTPSSEISVEIVAPEEGEQIGGNVVELEALADGIEITEPDGDISGTTGHFHVYIDRDPVAAGETISDRSDIVPFSADRVKIPGLGVGRHRFTLVLSDGAGTRLGRAADAVEVEVTGPSITSSAPEDAPMATGFTLSTTAEGVEIGSGEEGTRHLDLIINPAQDPEADGRPLPSDASHIHTTGTTHQVTGLRAGQHTIWVVLTDENHVPVSPLVADRVVVNIR